MDESPVAFRLLSAVTSVQVIAEGKGVKIREFLRETYGGRRWRKMKGIAHVEKDGWSGAAEVHWFEAHGVGKVRWKIKRKLQR